MAIEDDTNTSASTTRSEHPLEVELRQVKEENATMLSIFHQLMNRYEHGCEDPFIRDIVGNINTILNNVEIPKQQRYFSREVSKCVYNLHIYSNLYTTLSKDLSLQVVIMMNDHKNQGCSAGFMIDQLSYQINALSLRCTLLLHQMRKYLIDIPDDFNMFDRNKHKDQNINRMVEIWSKTILEADKKVKEEFSVIKFLLIENENNLSQL